MLYKWWRKRLFYFVIVQNYYLVSLANFAEKNNVIGLIVMPFILVFTILIILDITDVNKC